MGKAEDFFRREGFWPSQAYFEGDNYDIQEARLRHAKEDEQKEAERK